MHSGILVSFPPVSCCNTNLTTERAIDNPYSSLKSLLCTKDAPGQELRGEGNLTAAKRAQLNKSFRAGSAGQAAGCHRAFQQHRAPLHPRTMLGMVLAAPGLLLLGLGPDELNHRDVLCKILPQQRPEALLSQTWFDSACFYCNSCLKPPTITSSLRSSGCDTVLPETPNQNRKDIKQTKNQRSGKNTTRLPHVLYDISI